VIAPVSRTSKAFVWARFLIQKKLPPGHARKTLPLITLMTLIFAGARLRCAHVLDTFRNCMIFKGTFAIASHESPC
jgi:hypothetical protein